MSVDCLAHSQHRHTATEAVPSAVPCAHTVYIGHSTHQRQSCGNSLEIPLNMVHSNLITDNQILTMNVVIHKRVGRGQYKLQSRTVSVHYTCTKHGPNSALAHMVDDRSLSTETLPHQNVSSLYNMILYKIAYMHEVQYYT